MKTRFLALAALLCMGASAKTVALWPLESVDTQGGLRCVVNPSNDLSVVSEHKSNTDTDAVWALPPNPDTDRHAVEPINHSAVRETCSGSVNGFLYNDYTARFLRRDRAFTIEGWMKVLELPASNTWACILSAYTDKASGGNVDNNRWTLSLRRRPEENYACSWIFWGNGSGQDAVIYRYADEEASYAITNTWIHIAITHSPLVNGYDHWALYLNGDKVGELTKNGSVTDAYTRHRFDLGARTTSSNQIEAVFDYWRISDKVLAPSEFLCAGDSSGTPAPSASHTVAYWPLGVTETGGVDGRDAVGNSPLTGGFYGTKFPENCMTPVEDCAFTGNPPNTTVTLSEGNAGSFLGCATAATLRQDAIGACLNVTSNFTVEGWFCPRICERSTKTLNGEACCYLFCTRPDYYGGWDFQYRAKGIDKFQFDLYCIDGSDNLLNNVVISGTYDMKSWYDTWRHVALTYNATGGANGYGLWTLYIDGEQVGTVSNGRAPVAITEFRPFVLGGRYSVANNSFQGKIDCVRVSATVLSPNQFLNATNNSAAATDVVGFWPLNVINGVFPDLRDISGKNNHFASLDNYPVSLVTPDPDNQPTISNPDRSPTFRGDPSKVKGSTRFRNPDASTDNHKANLITGSTTVMNALAAGQDFTFECYYLHRSSIRNVGGDQETFLGYADGTTMRIRFFRKADGFYIWENLNASIADTKIPGTANGDLEYDRWYHVALVHSIEPINGVNNSMWRIYVDGILKGATSNTYNNAKSAYNRLFVGGRYVADKNAVVGNLSSVRLSDCALDPSDFLCATPTPVTKPEPTVGYWPIDSVQPGLANLAAEDYPLVADGTAAGQDDKARLSIPNKNALTNIVTGATRQNHGSYALGAGGVLAAASIGFDMAGPKPFTVEGWLNWTPAEGTADEDLVSVGDAQSGNGGLRIYFDKTGVSPKLRVFARGAWPCTPYVDGTFDADLTPLVGTWAHVAIAYDIDDVEGAWTLYVDGKQVGNKVKNFYRPTSIDYCRGGDFRIGSTVHPLSAAVDMWRVCTVAYAPDDLLFAPMGDMIMIFR